MYSSSPSSYVLREPDSRVSVTVPLSLHSLGASSAAVSLLSYNSPPLTKITECYLLYRLLFDYRMAGVARSGQSKARVKAVTLFPTGPSKLLSVRADTFCSEA